MTTPFDPPPRAGLARRYGPLALIVTLLLGVGVLTVTADDRTTAATDAGPGTSAPGGSTLPETYAQAQARGGDLSVYGDRCDPATGRIRMPTVYAAPCVPVFTGDNGGATGQGVTGDTIKVVNYTPQQNGDLTAALSGLIDAPEDTARTQLALNQILDDLSETYGRKVELIPFTPSGAADDETAGRADALEVANEIGAFASINGPSLSQSYADTLAQEGVLCIGCGLGTPDRKYQDNAPYMWGNAASPEEFMQNLGDLVVGRLNGKPASFAGDALKDQQRVFGVVHFEQDVPVFDQVREDAAIKGGAEGWQAALTETYTLDLAKAPERARTIIAKMKDAGVTSIIFLGDPLMPIYLTEAATEQDYYPEWVVTGTVLTDTTTLGRRYDPTQWSHAFGMSSLAARQPPDQSDMFRIHEWYYGVPPASGTAGQLFYPSLQILFWGIHLAGPDLNAMSFRDALFSYPPTGGGPTRPRVSFGTHGVFVPEGQEERTDYLAIDDVTLIWWDTDQDGPDESGKSCTGGSWRYMDGGARYLPGKMPATDLPAFDEAGTVVLFDGVTTPVPPEDMAPSYERPPDARPLPYDAGAVVTKPPTTC